MSKSLHRKFKISKVLIHIFFILLSMGFTVPLLTIISISLSNEIDIGKYGYLLIPKKIDFTAYKIVFMSPGTIAGAYKVTLIISFVGVLIYMIMASMCAYPLSRLDFKLRRKITFYLFFTMLFNGGLVPSYIMMTQYFHLKNSYWALILPLLGNVWYLFLMRTFFQQIPQTIIESATIDGANEIYIYVRIIIPLSKPVLATVGLIQLLTFWNSWYPALLYITKSEMYPLQYLLQIMLRSIQEVYSSMQENLVSMYSDTSKMPTESTRMAMCMVAIAPILFSFPFFQKYFVKGLTIGSIKG